MILKFNVEFPPLLYVQAQPSQSPVAWLFEKRLYIWLRELMLNFSTEIQMICFKKRGTS